MTYGIVAFKSCLLTQISQRLQENTKKRYTVDRLSDHLARGIPQKALTDYLRDVRSIVPSEPVIHIDDSDVIKPEGYHFESLGIIRDGSRSTPEKSVFCKGSGAWEREPKEAEVIHSSQYRYVRKRENHSNPGIKQNLRTTIGENNGGVAVRAVKERRISRQPWLFKLKLHRLQL